jgi:hypothetical protein
MSKFLQENFSYTNSEAGHLSSIPYIVASVAVPIFGNILSYAGEKHFELFQALALFFIAAGQILFRTLQNAGIKSELRILIPILFLGLGHALFTTLQGSLVKKLCDNPKLIPKIFSILKILEGTSISITIYANGLIRQATGSYFCVSLILITCSLAGGFGSVYLHMMVSNRV